MSVEGRRINAARWVNLMRILDADHIRCDSIGIGDGKTIILSKHPDGSVRLTRQ